MKKFNQAVLASVIILVFRTQIISAIYVPDKKTDNNKSENYFFQADTRLMFAEDFNIAFTGMRKTDLLIPGHSHLDLAPPKRDINTDRETGMKIEEWMIDLYDDSWDIEPEQPLIMEDWMLEPCDWLYKH